MAFPSDGNSVCQVASGIICGSPTNCRVDLRVCMAFQKGIRKISTFFSAVLRKRSHFSWSIQSENALGPHIPEWANLVLAFRLGLILREVCDLLRSMVLPLIPTRFSDSSSPLQYELTAAMTAQNIKVKKSNQSSTRDCVLYERYDTFGIIRFC